MTKFLHHLSLLSFGILFLNSCDESSKSRNLPRHSGESGEVLLVMDESKWLGPEGDSLRVVMEQFAEQLPQAEAMFSLLQFSPNEMSGLLEQHRNIIEIEIGPDAEGKNKVTLSKDKWSNDQLVFRAYANNRAEWNELLENEFPRVLEIINDKEVSRLQKNYKRNGNKELQKKIEEKFGIEMLLPLDTEVAVEGENFIWLKRERVKYLGNTPHDITQGFLIYRYPYSGEDAFTQENLMHVRDSILKKYVPGPKEGTYMGTEYRYPPTTREVSVGGQYAAYTQGLWRTENYFMGGPFRRIATTSKNGNEIIVVSGFVFAPKFKKREYVRELDAVISSVSL
ncbi:MAG TPA: DUF4837 family protein [Cryomorphaceae bacterium]|nr:DUF4837 family protein [Cryomorphaceae bacterium]